MSASPKELQKSLSKLSLATDTSPKVVKSKQQSASKDTVADSWEDEDSSAGSDSENVGGLSIKPSNDLPLAPPPTPVSPSTSYSTKNNDRFGAYEDTWSKGSSSYSSLRGERVDDGRRPEKTDAVAKRLIAGALGVRAPKKTDEQKAYDKAIREKEAKRREAEKEEARMREEEKERAKAAAWDD